MSGSIGEGAPAAAGIGPDPGRYGGPLLALAALLVSLFALNTLFLIAFGRSPQWLGEDERSVGLSHLETLGGRVAGVEAALRPGGGVAEFGHRPGDAGPGPALGVVLGQSSVLRDLDPRILEAEDGVGVAWLVLNGAGASFTKLEYFARPIFYSALRPAVAVLGIHPPWIVGERIVSGGREEERAPTRRPVNWIKENRLRLNYFVRRGLLDAREALFARLGLPAEALFTPSPDPWRMPGREDLPGRAPERRLAGQMQTWRARGWFDPETYTTEGAQAAALRRVVSGLRERGARVLVVLMPESSALRALVPPEAARTIALVLGGSGGTDPVHGDPVSLVDLRDSMGDEWFSDHTHLNPEGRKVFSALFAEKMRVVLGDRYRDPARLQGTVGTSKDPVTRKTG